MFLMRLSVTFMMLLVLPETSCSTLNLFQEEVQLKWNLLADYKNTLKRLKDHNNGHSKLLQVPLRSFLVLLLKTVVQMSFVL